MAGKPTSRYDVAKSDQWGRLVKSWATHLDYVSQAEAPQPPRKYWVNQTWPSEGSKTPAPATIPIRMPTVSPKPWCLPTGGLCMSRTPMAVRSAAVRGGDDVTRVRHAGDGRRRLDHQYRRMTVKNVIDRAGQSRDDGHATAASEDVAESTEDDLLNGRPIIDAAVLLGLFGKAPLDADCPGSRHHGTACQPDWRIYPQQLRPTATGILASGGTSACDPSS